MHTLFLLLRRSASFLYDSLLLIALFFVFTTAVVLANDGQSIAHPLFYFGLWIIGGVFFDGFWRHGGQTLGMRAWNLQMVVFDADKRDSTIAAQAMRQPLAKDTWKRYFAGSVLFGISYLWAFIDREGMTAHDRLSGTTIIKYSNNLKNKP